jgi:hypothetical protein
VTLDLRCRDDESIPLHSIEAVNGNRIARGTAAGLHTIGGDQASYQRSKLYVFLKASCVARAGGRSLCRTCRCPVYSSLCSFGMWQRLVLLRSLENVY